jgi:hypothetical protein
MQMQDTPDGYQASKRGLRGVVMKTADPAHFIARHLHPASNGKRNTGPHERSRYPNFTFHEPALTSKFPF